MKKLNNLSYLLAFLLFIIVSIILINSFITLVTPSDQSIFLYIKNFNILVFLTNLLVLFAVFLMIFLSVVSVSWIILIIKSSSPSDELINFWYIIGKLLTCLWITATLLFSLDSDQFQLAATFFSFFALLSLLLSKNDFKKIFTYASKIRKNIKNNHKN